MIVEADDLVAIIEYGATARGDADNHSDRDICAIVDDIDELCMERQRRSVALRHGVDERSVSCYRMSTVDKMVQGGSLFLWHLRLEGNILVDGDDIMKAALAALPAYDHFSRDLERFSGVFDDVIEEFSHAHRLSIFELHVLSVVVRNLCMLLTVKAGAPVFGRATVFAAARRAYPALPVSEAVWAELIAAHLAFMRNVTTGSTGGMDPHQILKEVSDFIEFSRIIFS